MLIIIFIGKKKKSQAISVTKSILLTDPGRSGLALPCSAVGNENTEKLDFRVTCSDLETQVGRDQMLPCTGKIALVGLTAVGVWQRVLEGSLQ